MSITDVRSAWQSARVPAASIASPALPKIDAVIAACDSIIGGQGGGSVWPAWRRGMTPGQWITLPTQASLHAALLAAYTDPQSVNWSKNAIGKWNGLALTPKGFMGGLLSGHNDGRGEGWQNSTIDIDATAEAPAWMTLHPGTPLATLQAGAGFAVNIGGPYYPDGLPCGRHSYFSQHFSARKNKLIVVGSNAAAAIYGVPKFSGGPQVEIFDRASGVWSRGPSLPQWSPDAGSVCMDPRTDEIYYITKWRDQKLYRLNADWTAWESLTVTGTKPWYFRSSMIDVQRHALVSHGGWRDWPHAQSPRELIFTDLTTLRSRTVPITGPYTTAHLDYSTMVGNPDSGKYEFIGYSLNPTTPLLEIEPDTGLSVQIDTVPSPLNGCNNRYTHNALLGGMLYQPGNGDLMFRSTQ